MELAHALECVSDAIYDEYNHTFRASTAVSTHDNRRPHPRFYHLGNAALDELSETIKETLHKLSEVSVEVQLLLEKRRKT
jgi:hypothetical protein